MIWHWQYATQLWDLDFPTDNAPTAGAWQYALQQMASTSAVLDNIFMQWFAIQNWSGWNKLGSLCTYLSSVTFAHIRNLHLSHNRLFSLNMLNLLYITSLTKLHIWICLFVMQPAFILLFPLSGCWKMCIFILLHLSKLRFVTHSAHNMLFYSHV